MMKWLLKKYVTIVRNVHYVIMNLIVTIWPLDLNFAIEIFPKSGWTGKFA